MTDTTSLTSRKGRQRIFVKKVEFIPASEKPIRTTNQLQFLLKSVLPVLEKSEHSYFVRRAVNPVRDRALDYYDVITSPMDLETVRNRLQHNYYWAANECVMDLELVVSNCFKYNPPSSLPWVCAQKLKELLDREIGQMHPEEIEEPITRSARTNTLQITGSSRNWLDKCQDIVDELFEPKHQSYASIFYRPVQPVKLGIPNYFEVISNPMDLSTIDTKLGRSIYTNAAEFRDDVLLMLRNCFIFNSKNNFYIEKALETKRVFEKKYKLLIDECGESDTVFNAFNADISEHVHQSSNYTNLLTNVSVLDQNAFDDKFESLSVKQRHRVVQIVKNYGDGSHICKDGYKTTIHYDLLSEPTRLAVASFLGSYVSQTPQLFRNDSPKKVSVAVPSRSCKSTLQSTPTVPSTVGNADNTNDNNFKSTDAASNRIISAKQATEFQPQTIVTQTLLSDVAPANSTLVSKTFASSQANKRAVICKVLTRICRGASTNHALPIRHQVSAQSIRLPTKKAILNWMINEAKKNRLHEDAN